MTPARFCKLAKQIAGPRWKTDLAPIIGRRREAVWAYANGKRDVPVPVQKLMELLAAQPSPQPRGLTTGKLKPTPRWQGRLL